MWRLIVLPKDECEKWGAYMRKEPRAFSDKNTVWRLLHESGAVGSPFGPTNPDWLIPDGVLDIHRLWIKLPLEQRAAFFARFALRGKPSERAGRVEQTKTRMYELSNQARFFMAGALSGVKIADEQWRLKVSGI